MGHKDGAPRPVLLSSTQLEVPSVKLLEPLGRRLIETDSGRLALGERELHCGDPLLLLVHGHWVPVRVEWSDRWGWYAACCQRPRDGDALLIRLRAGLMARLP